MTAALGATIYIRSVWIEGLREAGQRVELVDGGHTLLVDGKAFRVLRRARIRPSEIPPSDPEAVLWIPTVSARTAQALTEAGWSWVTDRGFAHIQVRGQAITLGRTNTAAELAVTGQADRTLAERAILGCLLEHPGAHRQITIAQATGITQARVSQVLRKAVTENLVVRTPSGWSAADVGRLFDICTSAPSVSALVQHWYHLDPPTRQIDLCLAAAISAGSQARVSGDWAADLLAPWRLPTLAIIHTDRTLGLDSAGFVPAESGEGTLLISIHPITDAWGVDPALEGLLTAEEPRWRLAPVHQIAHDILRTAGSDAEEAVNHLRARFIEARAAGGV